MQKEIEEMVNELLLSGPERFELGYFNFKNWRWLDLRDIRWGVPRRSRSEYPIWPHAVSQVCEIFLAGSTWEGLFSIK